MDVTEKDITLPKDKKDPKDELQRVEKPKGRNPKYEGRHRRPDNARRSRGELPIPIVKKDE